MTMARGVCCYLTLAGTLLTTGCDRPQESAGAAAGEATSDEASATPQAPAAGKGFDLEKKTVKLGALNDESGPGAAIGKPYALGKRILAAQVNAGGTGLLPEGWKVELIEKDHGYNPQRAAQAYNQLADEVAIIVTSFGTPNTLPLRPMLQRDGVIALPASLSSEMGSNRYTIPLGPSYETEAMHAMDYVVAQAGEDGKAAIKAAIVYQQDDYGKDGLQGFREAARFHGVEIVSEQTITPGQGDFTAVITGLKDAGATHVLLTVMPSASGKVLGTAAQLQYGPTFIGQTPAWVDGFFSPEVIPSAVFKNFVLVTSMPFWGEQRPGMDKFLQAFQKYGGDAKPNGYILTSYMQGLYALELVKRAIEAGTPTRKGVLAAVPDIEQWTAEGLGEPVSTAKFPYDVGNQTRILKPDFEKQSFTVLEDYASPKLLGGDGTAAVAAAAAPAAEGAPGAKALDQAATEAPAGDRPAAAPTAAAKVAAPKPAAD